MNILTDNQKATLERIKTSDRAIVLPVSAARALVAKGLIKSDGTKGHGKAKAAYVAA